MPEYELSDIRAKYISDASLDGSNRKVPVGKMHVSPAKAFILTFLAIAIAVGVGIIVHFAGTDRNVECLCNFPDDGSGNSGGSSSALEQCEQWAEAGNTNICSKCPNQPVASTCPPATSAPTTPAPPTSAAPTTHAPATTTTSSSGPTTTPSAPVLNVRLPTSLEPLLYELELQPNMYAPLSPDMFTFNGSVKLLVRCRHETDNITLHINKLNITGAITVMEENGIEDLYESHVFDTVRQFIIIRTTRPLTAIRNYTVHFEQFVGPLIADLAGLYLSSYTRGNETIHITTSQMQATDARKTFPCMDEPAIKAQFKVTLYRKDHMVSLSNMPVIGNQTLADNWVADMYQTTPAMPTYLLAFIVCDFRYKESVTTNNIKYRAWSRPEAINQTDYSLQVGVDILTYFEEFFNISYPLPKQDMIAIPDFAAGAMENWGLITYRETAMLYEPGVSSEGNKQRVAVVVSHELAHQWFGNLVTPSWWDDLWLNEGFASYVEYMGVDIVEPDWRMFDQFVVVDLQDVFSIDGLVSSHPVYVPVNHPDEINEIFDRISYAKGASIIRMMRFFLGDSIFKNGLTRYLRSRAYGAAFHDDLWNALGEQAAAEGSSRTNVKEIMDTWTLQMNYPVVMVTYEEAGRISLTQSRYLVDPSAPDPGKYVADYKWEIPFAYTTSSDRKFNVTHEDVIMMGANDSQLAITSATIPAPEGTAWVLGNPKQYGYYRVNYDERNWGALIGQLKTNHLVIHPINRAQIINDAWNLAKSGEVPMRTALGTTEYLNKERDYIPWVAASTELRFVANMLERHPLYGPFMRFMRNKTEDTFSVVTMNNTGATHIESFMRSEISSLACSFGIRECVDEAVRLFRQWMANPSVNPIDPGLKSNVYCTGVEEGGSEEWEFIYQQYQTANLAAEKSRLMYAMSCSKHVWILSRYLGMALDETAIRRQDTVTVIVSVSRNTVGRSLVWDFVRQNWDTFTTKYGHVLFGLKKLILATTKRFATEQLLDELKEFMDAQENLGSGARAFEQALENTRSNIGWMEKNVPIIQSWLTEQGF